MCISKKLSDKIANIRENNKKKIINFKKKKLQLDKWQAYVQIMHKKKNNQNKNIIN